jgi:23S rRNA pseudouridine1911/1915/1917 synthase
MAEKLILSLNHYAGTRLDKALADVHPELSRQQWQLLIKEEQVLINDKTAKSSYKVSGDENVVAFIPDVVITDLVAEDIPLDIRYEDNDLLVINKPAGMVVHPAIGHQEGTLVNAVLFHVPDLAGIGGEMRPGIVHRLDMDTSGLMIVAKNDHALRYLQDQFKQRTVRKIYTALVEGHIKPEQAIIDAPIGRNPRKRKMMSVIPPGTSAQSKEARTTYELLGTYDDFSLVRCLLHSGRKHQIRVHLAYIGYPIVGDAVYGHRKQHVLKDRHFLHSTELGFRRPSDDEWVQVSAELPPELQSLLNQLAR